GKSGPRCAKRTIAVAGDRQITGLEVLRDSEPVNPASWNHALPIDGGTYTITARAPGRTPWSTAKTIKVDSDAQVVEIPRLEVAPAPPAPVASPATPVTKPAAPSSSAVSAQGKPGGAPSSSAASAASKPGAAPPGQLMPPPPAVTTTRPGSERSAGQGPASSKPPAATAPPASSVDAAAPAR